MKAESRKTGTPISIGRGIVLFLLLLSALPLSAFSQVIATNLAIYTDAQGKYFYAQWTGIQPGHIYELQFTPDFRAWSTLTAVTNDCCTNCPWVQRTTIASHQKCFFRIRETIQ